MKKEILLIRELNVEYNATRKLENISLCLMQGECISLLGLVNSGKNLLVEVLCGLESIDEGMVYLDNKRIINMQELQKEVYKIKESNYLIDDWTVAEYVSLVSQESTLGVYRKKNVIERTEQIFAEMKLEINVNKKLKELSELEKRQVDLMKAYKTKAKILIIEDEFEGCTTHDIEIFKGLLNQAVGNHMGVIINSHSDNVSYILSDQYIIFKKGHIVKKCSRDYIQSSEHLEKFILGTKIKYKKETLDKLKSEQVNESEIVYSICPFISDSGKNLEFKFRKSEVISILALNTKEKENIFNYLSGRYTNKYMTIQLDQQVCSFDTIVDFVNNKIVSIAHMGSEDELLMNMTIGENLLMPSLHKISAIRYILAEHNLSKVLEKQVDESIAENGEPIKRMSTNDHIILLLERWYIFKPKVLVLFEPFVHCDVYGVSLVQSYIKKFSGMGTTVIIVKSREEYIEEISDRIINVDSNERGEY